ncbi:helix-turn-helix domain-containing protein [Pectinatus haikarae]|uniref:Transcriptional regulator with XRE-family HTH domain n=1 Tax=Pectinatus haikarae TaxID=349096 RepID=A0ABT9Y9A2_9FIRM|nr:helix-turn-helix domain-containing protein [Pectinatus haikarae]MDQ0204106.1 transcriptional regulator with XRE-family HTH domain [Pectinatus haikarae]
MKKESRLKKPVTPQQIEFANRLRNKRLEQNLSLQEVADKIGISKVTLSRYETLDIVNIPSDKIEELSKVYKTSPAYLMGWEKDVSETEPLPDLTKKDERQIQKKLKALLDDLDPAAGVAYYNDEEPISDEDKELLRISLENTLRLTKQLAKQKFTPKKYRKE